VVAYAHCAGDTRRYARRFSASVARDGSFTVEVPAEARTVSLQLEASLLTLPGDVEVLPGTRDAVLRPVALAEVRGRVLRPRVAVYPEEEIRVSCKDQSSMAVNDAGEFAFVVRPGRGYELTAEAGAFVSARVELEPLRPCEVREVELTLASKFAPHGIVTDAHDVPIADAWVEARALDGAWRDRRQSVHTQADGTFTLPPLEACAWEVRAHAAHRFDVRRTIELQHDALEALHLALAAPAVVRGRVEFPDGTPCPAALLLDDTRIALANPLSDSEGFGFMAEQGFEDDLVSLRANGGADGSFELEIEEPSAHLIAFARPFAPSAPFMLELGPGEELVDVVLRLRPACTLRGSVVDEDGQPLQGDLAFVSADGLRVELQPEEGRIALTLLPPGRGRIELGEFSRGNGLEGSCEVELVPEHATLFELHLSGKQPSFKRPW